MRRLSSNALNFARRYSQARFGAGALLTVIVAVLTGLVVYQTRPNPEYAAFKKVRVGMDRQVAMSLLEGFQIERSFYGRKEIVRWFDQGRIPNREYYVYVIDGRVVETDLEQ